MAKSTSGSFTGAGQSSGSVPGRQAEAIVSGVFTATVVPEVQDGNGNWAPFGDVAISAPSAQRFAMAVSRPWRLTVSAYTSGTIAYELAGEEFPERA